MKDRIKKLRKELDLTQQEFADRLGIKRGAIANYEIGRNTPVDSVVLLICKEFNVNENWLRNGCGEIFAARPADALEALAKEYNLSHNQYVFIEKFLNMKRDTFNELMEFFESVLNGSLDPDVTAFAPAPEKVPREMTIDEKVADYRRQLELEAESRGKSSVLQDDA